MFATSTVSSVKSMKAVKTIQTTFSSFNNKNNKNNNKVVHLVPPTLINNIQNNQQQSNQNQNNHVKIEVHSIEKNTNSKDESLSRLRQKIAEHQTRRTLKFNWNALNSNN